MNNREVTRQLIIEHLEDENYYFAVNRTYNKFMDSLDGGVFLSQLVYWSDHVKRSDGFFYKTAKEWHDELHLSKHQVDKHTKKLCELGIIETKKIKANGSPTIHYKLHVERLIHCLSSFLKNLKMETEKIENGNLNNSTSNIEISEMENQNIENGKSDFQISNLKKSENVIEKIENENPKNSISLTKNTTKIITDNTQDISSNNNNKDYQTETADKDDRQERKESVSSAVNLPNTKENEKVVGRSSLLSDEFLKKLDSVKESYEFAFADADEQVINNLSTLLRLYPDERLICEAINVLSQQDIPSSTPTNDIPALISDWRSKGINTYEQLIQKTS